MATPDAGLKTASIHIQVVSGARTPMPPEKRVLFTLMDGYQQILLRDYYPSSFLVQVPFHGNFGDNYTVVAMADGYEQAGFTPVSVTPDKTTQVSLMLLSKDASFNFLRARWDALTASHPDYVRLLSAGAANPDAAQSRYMSLMEERPAVLACFLNLATAMADIHLPAGAPNEYLKQLIWDQMDQDRFLAWTDPQLLNQVAQAAASGKFAASVGTALFHQGATRSWKEVQFSEANVKFTFHESDTALIDGTQCVKVEVGVEYFKDPQAHDLVEVIANTLTGGLTDPRDVYRLRWTAARRAGEPDFDPPYVLD
jgi:hypothetical protein